MNKGTLSVPAGSVPVLAVAAAYANAVRASFQFDDWNVIVDEPKVQGLVAWWHSMPGIRPLLKLSYALNRELSPDAAGYHLVNVAIHAANAWLIFALLARRSTRFVALTAALIFALHPVQTEAVTYVMGRSCSLSTLFVLLTLYASTRWAPALFASALLVKETAIMTIVPGFFQKKGWWLVAVVCGGAIVALASPRYRHLLSVSLQTRDIGTNLLTQANGVVYLLGQLVRLDRLNVDPHLPVISSWSWTVAVEVALIVGLIALGLALFKRHPEIGYGILWLFIWLVPTNSVLPRLDVANDRQLYLAMAGPAWLVAYGFGKAASRWGPRLPIAAATLLCVGLGTATHLRNRDYGDEITFWGDVVAKSPSNPRGHNNLGYALALAHRDDDAEAEFRRAIDLDPAFFMAVINLKFLQEGTLMHRSKH